MNPSFYSTILDLPFDEINLVDTEYRSSPGNRPEPVCLIRWELRRGLKQRFWINELGAEQPYSIGKDAAAELSFHKAMGWPLPKNNLDLFIEHRNATNGRNLPQGNSLIGALILRHLDSIGSETKELMRDLILRGGRLRRSSIIVKAMSQPCSAFSPCAPAAAGGTCTHLF